MGLHRPYKPRKFAVGERLLALRARSKLTQAELAARIGASRRTVQSWEAGEAYPQEEKLRPLISVFLAAGAFTAGEEIAEAAMLWQVVSQDSPRWLAPFDEKWFVALLAQSGVAHPPKLEAEARAEAPPEPTLLSPPTQRYPLVDWGEAPDMPSLYGRQSEMATLEQWVLTDHCRVVALLGLGGIGKTSLAITFARLATARFDTVFFRSLRNAPPLSLVLDMLIQAAAMRYAAVPETPDSVGDKIGLLIQLFREHHYLVVLDNMEAILQPGAYAGQYRTGYEEYGLFIQRLGETPHTSCLLLTSREKPAELGPLEGPAAPVRSLSLTGLANDACRAILEEKALFGLEVDVGAVAKLYGGNPLALKLISEPIQEIFGGDLRNFLSTGDAFFNGVGKLLEQQFQRSTLTEQALLYWLAIEREWVSLDGLVADFAEGVTQRIILTALESLRRRLLIERRTHQPAFTLQPVIMEYVTDRLIERIHHEIVEGRPLLLSSHALVQATAKEYIRRSQERVIAWPLLQKLTMTAAGSAQVERQLLALLALWREQLKADQEYGAGNVVNLFRLLRGDLRGLDFSHLVIRQAYLQEFEAQDLNLNDAHLSQCVITEAFEYSTCVALSAAGDYLAAGTQSGEVRVWRTGERTPVLSIAAHSGGVYGITIAADSQLLVSSAIDGIAKIWAIPSGQLIATLGGHMGGVYCVTLSNDGQVVASGGADGTVRLWEANSGLCLTVLEGHTGAVWDLAFVAGTEMLLSSSLDGAIRVWHVAEHRCMATLLGHSGPIWGIALHPGGQLLASGGADGTVRLWALEDGRCLNILQGHTGGVRGVAFTSGGHLLISGGLDRTLRLWDSSLALSAGAEMGACLAVLHGHRGGIWDVAASADGRLLASASFDGTIRLWDPESRVTLALLQGFSGTLRSVALAAHGQLIASGSFGGFVRLWEPEGGVCRLTLNAHAGMVFGVALSAGLGMLASCGHDEMVRLWGTENGQILFTMSGHTDAVMAVAFGAGDTLLASAGRDGTIRLWNPSNGNCMAIWQAERAGLRDLALLADGSLLASGSFDGVVRLWDVQSGRTLLTLQEHTGMIWRVAFSGDGRRVAGAGDDGTIRVWDTEQGHPLALLAGHTGAVYGVALSDDGRLAVSSGHDGTIRWWDVTSGSCQRIVERSGMVWNVALSQDGQRIASAEFDGTVALWETTSGALLRALRSDRPYERADITNLTGVTDTQRAALKALGAVDRNSDSAN